MNIEVDNPVPDEAIGVCSTLSGVEKVLRIDAI